MNSDFIVLPTWHFLVEATAPELPCPVRACQPPVDCFVSPSFWDKSTDTSSSLMFDSAHNSLASSPPSPPPNIFNGGSLIRELIGKMGGSGELSRQGYNPDQENAPKWGQYYTSPALNPAGFPDLSPTAKFPSLLGTRSLSGWIGQFTEVAAMGKMPSSPAFRPLGSPPAGTPEGNKSLHLQTPALNDRTEVSNSREDSHSTEAGARLRAEASWRKRKPAPRGKEAETEDGSAMKKANRSDHSDSMMAGEEVRGRGDEDVGGEDEKLQVKSEAAKPPTPAEPPKDYIHVRARRGQATDSHSLAERVRREKISERMKILQDLVPGCNKVTGKALMLDEITNYVQSLQRQVEFLSMKLASVNSMDTDAAMAKDVLFQSESGDPQQRLPISSSAYSADPLNNTQFLPGFHGGDLQRIVQMI